MKGTKIIKIPMRPFPAVRSNNNTRTHRVEAYHDKMNELAFLLRKECLNHKITKEEIIEKFIEGTYKIVFYFKIPKGKEKLIKLEDPHQSSPDIDNCFKGFTDTLFYHADRNDREIWTINAEKKYQAENSILLYIF